MNGFHRLISSRKFIMFALVKILGINMPETEQNVKTVVTAKKDPGIAALISIAGFLVLGAPSLGYFYIGEVRKGIVYLVAAWLVSGIVIMLAFGSMVFAMFTYGLGMICLIPIFLVALVFNWLVIYDVYLMAKGEPAKLPNI